MKPKILVTAPLDFLTDVRSRIERETDSIYAYGADFADIRELLSGHPFGGWMCAPCPTYLLDGALLDLCPTLRIVATPSTGSNHIDIEAARERGIEVFTLRGTEVVNRIYASSEFTFNLLISTVRRTPFAFDAVRAGHWREVEDRYRGRELNGMTVGIVGFGRIGGNLARYCQPFGMRVLAYDPYNVVDNPEVEQVACRGELLGRSDIVAACVHLSAETRKMIDERFFAQMKDGAYFINTSRGDVVDEFALLRNLLSGKLTAAGLDVISDEFLGDKSAHPLIAYAREHENLIITPHIAGLTFDSERKAQTAAYEAVVARLTRDGG